MSKLKVALFLFIFAAFLPHLSQAQTVSLVRDFEGIQWNEKKPPDPDIAAGPNHIVLTVNNGIQVYTKDGVKLSENTLRNWFSSLGISEDPVDPKIVFNNYCNRWIVFAITRSSGLYLLSVSKTDDPMGQWYHYKFDALEREQGGYIYPPDYTGLGYNSEAVYITSNHLYDYVPTHDFQWAKIKAISLIDLISGVGSPKSKDFTKMRNEDQSYAKNIKPVDYQFGSSTDFYLVNTSISDANFITVWKISDPFGNNASITRATINIGLYSTPNDAPQPGGARLIEINDTRISDCTYNNGFIYGCFHSKNSFNNGSAVRYFKLRVSDYSLLINDLIEQNGIYYYYPELYPDRYGNMVCMFNKSSASDYVGLAWTYRLSDATATGPINWLQQGQGYYDRLNGEVNRWGDYNGICLDPVEHNNIWFVGEYAKSGNIWGTKVGSVKFNDIPEQMTFTNLIGNENAGGSFTVEGIPNPIPSGQSITLIQDHSYIVSTNNERFSNWMNSGTTYKHHDWNDDNNEYLIKHNFPAGEEGKENQKAKFLNLSHCAINVLVDGELINDKGSCEFHDPWFVLDNNNTQTGDFWKPFNSYYEPNGKEGATEKGVFLGQRPTQGKYYSVRIPLMQSPNFGGSIGIRNCYFRNWDYNGVEMLQPDISPSGYDQKAVVFNADNAFVTANYKGHLLSSTLNASGGSGSQRKIAKEHNGNLHVVYESVGKVWYTSSTDGGATWSAEMLISGTGTATSPCIAASESDFLNDVFCVWQETEGSTRNLYIKPLLYPSEAILLDSDASTVDLQPSIGVSSDDNGVLVAYKKMYSGRYQMHYKYSDDCGNSFSYGGPVSISTPIVDNNPSIAWNPDLWKFMVSATRSSGSVQVNLYSFDYYGTSWDMAVKNVYSSSQIPLAPVYSQVAVDGAGRTHISWIAYDDYYGNNSASFHRSYKNGVFSGISTFKDDVYYEPSIVYTTVSGHENINNTNPDGGVSIFYSPAEQVCLYNMVSTNGTSWNGITYITPSAPIKYPNSLEKAPAGSVTYVVSKGSSLPYQVTMQTVNNTRASLSYTLKSSSENVTSSQGMENVKTFRRIEIIDTTSKTPGRFVLQMGNFKGSSLSFYKPDSLKKKEVSLSSFMRTEGFTFDKDASFSTDLFVKKTGWNGDLKLRLELVEEGSEKILQKVYEGSLGKMDSTSEEKTLKVANRLGKLKAYLRVSVDGIGKENLIVNNMDVYLLNSGKGKAEKPEKELVESETAPVEYALSQNYPNPFNPSTVINYEIPKTSRVTLKIFDMLGKEVTTLVNEYKEQGRYSVEFNASHLPSGTYIYELRANDFVKSGKMLLLK
ncbi:MAG: T9SS type A sorting domain-containing protein [Ignavibacteria bacterium]|jgi:hypothetical protein|nr:T9SS type A sorting domain-containing protein [Ignavibacteria bacterium]